MFKIGLMNSSFAKEEPVLTQQYSSSNRCLPMWYFIWKR